MDLANELIQISKLDLKASKLLYKNKMHAQSFFYFQQASEKANKAYGLIIGQIKEKDIRKISHDQILIHKMGLNEHRDKIKSFIEATKRFPDAYSDSYFKNHKFEDYHNELLKTDKFFSSLSKKDLVKLSLYDINEMLQELNRFKRIQIKPDEKYKPHMKEKMTEYAKWIGQFGTTEALRSKKEILDLINSETEFEKVCLIIIEVLKPTFVYLRMYYTLLFISFVTIQHSTLARYPQKDKKRSPLKIYNLRLPVVKKQPELLSILNWAIKKLDLYYKEKNKIKTN